VLDEICRFSAKTPTDASYIIIENVGYWLNDIDRYRQSIKSLVINKFEYVKNDVDKLHENIRLHFINLIKKIKSDLENFYNQIMSFSPERLKKY
jgi:exonuclease VII large subunit